MSNSRVLKAGLGYTIGNYLLKGLAFLTIPVFARLLSTNDYGIVNTFSAYESIMFVVIGMAIHTSFKNARYKYSLESEGADPGEDYRTYVSNAFSLIWLSGTIWLVLAFCFKSQLSHLLKLDSYLLLLLIIYSTSNAIVVAYNSDLSINYEYKKYLIIATINSIGNILISLLLILTVWPSQRYLGRIIGTVVPIVAIGVYLTLYQVKKNKPRNFFPMIKWGLNYSLPIVPHGISQIVLSSFDRIMITYMISNSATGLYSFAYNIFVIVQVTATSLDTVWGPWFYEKRRNNDLELIKRYSTVYILFLLLFSGAIMLISPELVLLLGGERYGESVYCVIPIVCGGFFSVLYNVPASVEYYHEKTKYIASATIIAALVNIILNYYFITRYGYIAAAYTTLITYMLYFMFHFFISCKIEKKSLFSKTAVAIAFFGILVLALVSLVLVNHIIIRFLLAISIIFISIIYEEKTIAYGGKLINSLLKKIRS